MSLEKPSKGDTFAVLHGKYVGKFITYCRNIGNISQFLMYPGENKVLELTSSEWNRATKSTNTSNVVYIPYLEFVQTLPDNVFSVIEEQFKQCNEQNKVYRDFFQAAVR